MKRLFLILYLFLITISLTANTLTITPTIMLTGTPPTATITCTTTNTVTPNWTATPTPTPEPLVLIGVSNISVKVVENQYGRWVNVDLEQDIRNLSEGNSAIYDDEEVPHSAESAMMLMKIKPGNVEILLDRLKETDYKVELINAVDSRLPMPAEIVELYKEEPDISIKYSTYNKTKIKIQNIEGN